MVVALAAGVLVVIVVAAVIASTVYEPPVDTNMVWRFRLKSFGNYGTRTIGM